MVVGTRIIETEAGPELAFRDGCLCVVAGPDDGRQSRFAGTALRVGTDADNDLVLSDETVSARHFEIVVTEDGFLLRDVGSTNGTTVGGFRAREVYLTDGATIVAGTTRLELRLADREVRVPLSRRTNFGQLLGHGAAMRAAFAVLERAAKTDATVLLLGESGTGKELAARALHDASTRRDGPYVVLDCGATTPSLIAAQLFGHARGAFTGAIEARAGVFEDADGGTLVLDEIGELPLEMQPKLLRAVETRTVQRLGETEPRAFDVRFVACTNRNLEEEVRAGRFRQDLFFRLSVITVRLPPLRERREEIGRLVHHFLSARGVDPPPDLDRTLRVLASHEWPGNVRELRNFAERLAALPDLGIEHWLPRSEASTAPAVPSMSIDVGFHEAKARFTDELERRYLEALLEAHGDNLSEAARVAGLSRQSCYRLLRKHGLRTD